MPAPRYTTTVRRRYIESQDQKYRFDQKDGYSLRDIAYDVQAYFNLENAPSPTTIGLDLKRIAKAKEQTGISEDALTDLDPENFSEWRSNYFIAPGGQPYETPPHQEAWFWLAVSLALRVRMPDRIIAWFARYEIEIDVNDWIDNQEYLYTIWLLAPPRHGKTDLLRHLIVWLICKQPNIRIIWASINRPIAKLTTEWLKRELEENTDLIEAYGPFEREGSWSDERLIVATRTVNLASPTIVALGKNAAAVSRDADIIFMDDIVDITGSESAPQNERDVRKLKANIFSRREPHTPVMGIGSHVPSPVGDIYELMEDEEKQNPSKYNKIRFVKIPGHEYTLCHSGATDKIRHGEWCLLWPTVRPFWFLEAMRNTYGDAMFEVIVNQKPRKGGIEYFREKVIRGDYPTPVLDEELGRYRDMLASESPGVLDRSRSFGQLPNCCGKESSSLFIAIGFDPAAGETRHAAESALTVRAACRHCGRRYTIDIWHARISPEQHPETIRRYASEYRPHRVRVEINAYQKALARDPRLRDAAADLGFVLDEWMTDERRNDPILGIPRLATSAEAGRWSIPYQFPQDQTKAEPLLRQLGRWPNKPNDLLFSEWLAEMSLAQLIEESLYSLPVHTAPIDEIPQYLLDMEETVDLSMVGRGGLDADPEYVRLQ